MEREATVLRKFAIAELELLPPQEQDQILTSCWESNAVRSAWQLYSSAPQQLTFVPAISALAFAAVFNVQLVWVFLMLLPILCVGFFLARRIYATRLRSILREAVTSRLPKVARGHT
jgi:hypothetical protein